MPNLARTTRQTYAHVWARHAQPRLGGYRLRDLTVREVEGFRAELHATGVGDPTIGKTLTMLQRVLRSAVEWSLLAVNPVAPVKKPSQRRRRNVVPLAPAVIERMLASPTLAMRDRTLVAVLAYAGLRPGEALALRWRHVGDRTLQVEGALSLGEEKTTKDGRMRSVPMLAPLREDLEAYRGVTASERDTLLFPAGGGGPWQDHDWRNWRRRVFRPLSAAVDVDATPYDLRHAFVSLLIHEGRSVVDVARRAGHSPQTCLARYAHVFDEFDGMDRRPAEDVIWEARRAMGVRGTFAEAPVAA